MSGLRFGLSGCGGGLESAPPEQLVELAQLAQQLGFEALWLNEEHFQSPRAGHGRLCLSPVVLAATLAAHTSRLRLGFSVLILPLYQPLRLAEEIATWMFYRAGASTSASRAAEPAVTTSARSASIRAYARTRSTMP